jgi:perosamine synthetase
LKDGYVIPVFKPEMNKEEILPERAKIFDSGWIGLGPKTAEFKQRFAEYIGVKYAVGVNSATAVLHIANVILGTGLERFEPIQNGR